MNTKNYTSLKNLSNQPLYTRAQKNIGCHLSPDIQKSSDYSPIQTQKGAKNEKLRRIQ